MTLEEKKNKLRKYAIAIDRLARKCREADRWDSMAEGTGGIVQAGRRRGEPDVIKETAIAVRQEWRAACLGGQRPAAGAGNRARPGR